MVDATGLVIFYTVAIVVLVAESLLTGQGYRRRGFRNRPGTHFPPGYPAALAMLWSITGRSLAAAHLFSCACTVVATLTAWLWFRCFYPPRVAFMLGLALASELDIGDGMVARSSRSRYSCFWVISPC